MIIKGDELVNQAYRSCFIYNSCLQVCQEQAVSRLSSWTKLLFLDYVYTQVGSFHQVTF